MYKNGAAIDYNISYFVTSTQSVSRNMCKGNDKIEYLQFLYHKKIKYLFIIICYTKLFV